jgi:GNAT superfamily N-acetyltransferase
MYVNADRSTIAEENATGMVIGEVQPDELDAVNSIIEAAIGTWNISPRVKRMVLPSYQYNEHDFAHFTLLGARVDGQLVGLASLEPADSGDIPEGQRALLVHGIYVKPERHGAGIGARLVSAATGEARRLGYTGLLVRAERSAVGFFEKQGFDLLPVLDSAKDYPYRLWLALAQD